MDILDNGVHFIPGEDRGTEDSGEGEWRGYRIPRPERASAACNRVAVLDGHTACVSLRFVQRPHQRSRSSKQGVTK